MAHVNMMTDFVIANLPVDGLQVVLCSLLAARPDATTVFEQEVQQYLRRARPKQQEARHDPSAELVALKDIQRLNRCMVGSGLCFESLELLGELSLRAAQLHIGKNRSNITTDSDANANELATFLASIDGDIVQAMTGVEKALFVPAGSRALTNDEKKVVLGLHQALTKSRSILNEAGCKFPYERGFAATSSILRESSSDGNGGASSKLLNLSAGEIGRPSSIGETFTLNSRALPRLFTGLWQLSSPAWGTASTDQILSHFGRSVGSGFTAFDMADHYGDAELIFGRFRSAYPHQAAIFAATKYCVFHPLTVTREAVRGNVSERCRRMQMERLDLLQFHWNNYQDSQYLDALRFLQEDDRVGMIGLCNFDTEHLEAAITSGVNVWTNQVQFSLIDSRPTMVMADCCMKHNVKLLTYGTLCGGFLADKWLDKPDPSLYDADITPSQRKYYGMIRSWGGWGLFQELLKTLHNIAQKHGLSISNVATRWVLDFPYVGAVLVGTRMGVSEHTSENLASLGWNLDRQDKDLIQAVLTQSRREEMFKRLGDCGGEYRT